MPNLPVIGFVEPQLFILTFIYLLYLALICRRIWKKSKRRFSYSIMDIYAFTLGFMPTLVLFAWAIKSGDSMWYWVIVMLGSSQLTGFVLGVLERPQDVVPWAASFHVLLGTLGGLALPLLFMLIVWVAYVALILFPLLLLIAVPLSPLLIYQLVMSKKSTNAQKLPSAKTEDKSGPRDGV